MKRLYNAAVCACALLLIGTCAPAYAGLPGSSCTDAIPMGENYSVHVQSGQVIWYSAWTFDLPLTVTFAPDYGKNEPAPEVELDFTCTPGYYKDSILCGLFCETSSGAVKFDMPVKPDLKSKTLDDGTFVYYLSLGKKYRDLLLQTGISYNVEAFVKVTYKCSGTISLAPDDLFTNCVDKAKFMRIGDTKNDTVQVKAKDTVRHVIIPYVQWQEDTIIYKWTGTAPCTMTVANTCEFDPLNKRDDNIIQMEENIQSGDSAKVLATDIYKWVHNPLFPNEAGMYFAKFYTEGTGTMKIVKAKQAPPRGKATLLRFDRTYALNANEKALFAIPRSWEDDTLNTKFVTPTEHIFRMVIATDPDFAPEHTLKEYQFEKTPTGHWQGIYGADMVNFWKQTTEQYLYIRFDCTEATTVVPSKWMVSKCVVSTEDNVLNSLDTTFVVKRNSTGGNYRVRYARMEGGDVTFTFTPKEKCELFIATDCNIASTQPADNLLYYGLMTKSNNSVTVSASEIAGWKNRVGEDGYIYMRIQHKQAVSSSITMTSTAPEETNPEYPASTVSVVCEGTKVVVNVSEEQYITIRSASDEKVDEWEATPGTPKELNLPPGTYVLDGKSDKIQLIL